jgi:hypothetical protein
MVGPSVPSMPVLLRHEYGNEAAGVLSQEQMLEAARAAGLERERLEPVCMVVSQELSSGSQGQRFFVVFRSPGFTRAREELSRLLQARGASGFDPLALRPILAVASTAPDFDRWAWPLRVNDQNDCTAPVTVSAPN